MNIITQGLGADEIFDAPDPDGSFLLPERIMTPAPPEDGHFILQAPAKAPSSPENGQFG